MPKFGEYGAATTLADSDVTVFSTSAGTKKITIRNIANKIKSLIGITSIVKVLPAQSVTSAGGTLTFTDSSIKDTSLIEVYATTYGIAPSNVVATAGKCVVTFDAQDVAFDVRITVRN